MRDIAAVLVVVALGLLLVGGVGGVAAEGPSGDVPIDDGLETSNGTVGVVVTLGESESVTDVSALQAHASETQEPLAAFAGETAGVTVETQFWLTNAALVTVDTDRVSLDTLAAVEGVEALRENTVVTIGSDQSTSSETGATDGTDSAGSTLMGASSAGSSSSDASSGSVSSDSLDTTYGLEQINAPDVWEAYGTQGAGASVAVLDTGADDDHDDIDVVKWAHFDEDGNEKDTEPQDGNGHGTHVSGTATGGAASGTAIGVAPDADLYAAKVLEDDGSGSFAQILAGMEWAVEEDADVMTMSLGAEGYIEQFIDPVRNAHDAGTVVVASIGNDGEGTSSSPGNVYDAISVGASDENEDITGFSSGEEIDTVEAWAIHAPPDWPDEYVVPSVAAPGHFVYSAEPGGTYGHKSGTSMAAPHVSGAIALLEAALSDELSPAEYGETLEETARKPDDWEEPEGERDTRYGSGIVDVMAAADSLDDGPNLVVSSIDHPETIAPDENLTVDYSIENIGDEEGTESTVALLVEETDESQDDTDEDVTVGAGETANGTLTFDAVEEQFEHGDSIAFTVELVDFEDSVGGTTDVEADPAEFLVTILDAEDAVEGEELAVTAEIENTGDLEGTQEITLDVPDLGENETTVTLAGGESTEETLAVATEAGDAGEYEATVASENDTASANVTVLAQAAFTVEIVEAGDVAEGEDLTVTAEIANDGDVEDTQTIGLDVPDLGENATTVTLAGGESTNETLSVATEEGDAGDYEATVASENDEDSANVTVHDETGFIVSILGVEHPIEGEDIEVTAKITHVGDGVETQNIVLDVPKLGSDETEVILTGGASTEETLTVATETGDAGSYTATVASDDDEDSVAVRVGLPPLPGQDQSPQDLTGDGLHEDIDGDGAFTIFDVQAFFNHFDSDEVQNHAWAYNFNDDDGDISIFDVQALFNRLKDS